MAKSLITYSSFFEKKNKTVVLHQQQYLQDFLLFLKLKKTIKGEHFAIILRIP